MEAHHFLETVTVCSGSLFSTCAVFELNNGFMCETLGCNERFTDHFFNCDWKWGSKYSSSGRSPQRLRHFWLSLCTVKFPPCYVCASWSFPPCHVSFCTVNIHFMSLHAPWSLHHVMSLCAPWSFHLVMSVHLEVFHHVMSLYAPWCIHFMSLHAPWSLHHVMSLHAPWSLHHVMSLCEPWSFHHVMSLCSVPLTTFDTTLPSPSFVYVLEKNGNGMECSRNTRIMPLSSYPSVGLLSRTIYNPLALFVWSARIKAGLFFLSFPLYSAYSAVLKSNWNPV
jgi:hypothetical protein